ncbi:MAG: hypothetical protein P9L92_11190 [Candidatus Electryonea clarkiae]|nr:hypothetical protein [Candidatus Electryonea clarkiae]MDP8288081.1 hypothetical protein [Candidatus Electryonea clarkiae]
MSEDLILTSKVVKQLSSATVKLSTRAINDGIKKRILEGFIQVSSSGRYRFYIHKDKIGDVEKAWKEGKLGKAGGWSEPELFNPEKHGELIKDYEDKMAEVRNKRNR